MHESLDLEANDVDELPRRCTAHSEWAAAMATQLQKVLRHRTRRPRICTACTLNLHAVHDARSHPRALVDAIGIVIQSRSATKHESSSSAAPSFGRLVMLAQCARRRSAVLSSR